MPKQQTSDMCNKESCVQYLYRNGKIESRVVGGKNEASVCDCNKLELEVSDVPLRVRALYLSLIHI